MPLYVIGHRNPDTDAICSAIGYAHLLREEGIKAEAARCGEVNARTLYALEQAGVPQPRLLMDVRPTAGQICQRDIIAAGDSESLFTAFNRMRRRGLRSLPVVAESGRLVGMLSMLKMVDMLLPETGGDEARLVHSSLDRIVEAVGGSFQHSRDTSEDSEFLVTVSAMSAESFIERLRGFPPERVILVTADRPTIQAPAIEYGVRCMVITGGYKLSPPLLEKARARGVTIILTPHDTASTTVLMKCAKRVIDALLDSPLAFAESDVLETVQQKAQHSSQILFPVLDTEARLVGVFSKSDLLDPPLTRLILVDHNELGQAVGGIEHAEILEVVDHHRLGGGLITREPIRFINEPVGSTCTIVARLFRDRGRTPTADIALCLATGIISDTLMLTSPTTTTIDRDILNWLESHCGRDLKAYAEAFFAAGSVLQVQSAHEAVRSDCKEYEEGDWKLAIAQIEELGLERFWQRRTELQDALDTMRRERGLDFACLFVTDIGLHYSVLLTSGDEALRGAIDYPRIDPEVFELDGIVSRKKQLLPHLGRLFAGVVRS